MLKKFKDETEEKLKEAQEVIHELIDYFGEIGTQVQMLEHSFVDQTIDHKPRSDLNDLRRRINRLDQFHIAPTKDHDLIHIMNDDVKEIASQTAVMLDLKPKCNFKTAQSFYSWHAIGRKIFQMMVTHWEFIEPYEQMF